VFSEEDHSLFLACRQSLSPNAMKDLEEEASGDPYMIDMFLMRHVFGPDQ